MKILQGDCFELIKDLPDDSVDLVITSPPYADIINYGKNISVQKPEEYCDWLLPMFDEIHRVLKPSGSFILNINDNCKGGYRNTFVYELIYRSQKETKLKFYDTYIWHKMNGIPNGSLKRFRNNTEFIFHFVKDQKKLKFYMDRALKEPAKATSDRAKYKWDITNHGEVNNGERSEKKIMKIKYLTGNSTKSKEGYVLPNKERIVPFLIRPDNVVRFHTAGHARDNTIKHPAPFYKDLPKYYINLLTDENDTVLDIFGGIMTTGLACKEIGNRHFIGMELNEKYAEFGKKRINGEELIVDEYVINQYDQEENFIQSFNTPLEIEKYFDKRCDHNIRNILRGFKKNFTLWGYKWKLEKRIEK